MLLPFAGLVGMLHASAADVVTYADDTVTVSETAYLIKGKVISASDTVTISEAVTTRLSSTGGETHMAPPSTRPIPVWEDGSALILDRWTLDHYGDLVVPGNVVALSAYVYDLDGSAPATATHVVSYDPAELISASLTVHQSGKPDANGYNFRHRIPPQWMPEGGHRFRVEYEMVYLNDTAEYVDRKEVWRYEGVSEGRFSA